MAVPSAYELAELEKVIFGQQHSEDDKAQWGIPGGLLRNDLVPARHRIFLPCGITGRGNETIRAYPGRRIELDDVACGTCASCISQCLLAAVNS